MKRISFLLLSVLFFSACNNTEKIELFNGTNLDNWTIFLPDTVNESDVFKVENGLIHISGIPNGYMRTREKYSSYKLHVEWRWTEEPKNSGVLLNITGKDMIWPNCIEAQLQAGNAGDIVLIGKGAGITINEEVHTIESEENRYAVLEKQEESSENAPGEWNTYDITVNEKMIELLVNGVLQNRGINPSLKEGAIGIQSEGGPMEFRNIWLEILN